MFQVAAVSYMRTCDQKEATGFSSDGSRRPPPPYMLCFWEGFFLDCGDDVVYVSKDNLFWKI